MTFPCTRQAPGSYEYRGFEVFRQFSESYGVSWFVTPSPDGEWWDNSDASNMDPQETKADAKWVVDQFCEARA